jgi:uncharacterized membrane protein YeiH
MPGNCERTDMNILLLLDYAGVAVFAATGALAASRRQVDLIGFIFLAIVTGVGGGTLRDLILGETPVFWVEQPAYLIVATATAVIVYFTAHLVWSRFLWLLWLDAVGLSAYCVIGAAKGLALGVPAPIAVVTGVMTATFGGILRDIVAGEPSVLMRREIYVTAALVGASLFVVLQVFGAPSVPATIASALAAFAARGGALHFGWEFPVYRARAGRAPEDVVKPRRCGIK